MNENKLIFVLPDNLFKMRFIKILIPVFFFFQIITSSCGSDMKEMRSLEAVKLGEIKAKLGEGSIWDYNKKILYWIDIENGVLYEYNPVLDTTLSHHAGKKIGTVVPETDSTVVLALEDGIYRMFLKDDTLEFLSKPASLEENQRFNDGKCDPSGRFWVGSMGPDKSCFLYCMNNERSIIEILNGVTISNGIIWSLDSSKMYYIDTPTHQVRQFDFDNQSGNITAGKVIIEIPDTLGAPDGMTIDSEGKLWIALWGGYGVGRFDPVSGTLLEKINVPAKNITSCAFGGENLDILFITSASVGMTDDERSKLPDAGKLFSINPGVQGIKTNFINIRKKDL